MLKRFYVLVVLFTALPSLAFADQLHMNDGSVLSGKITGVYGGQLGIETSFAGALEIDAAAIKGIQTDMPMITQMKSGDRIAGTLAYDEKAGQRIYSKALGAVSVMPSDIQAIWQRSGAGPELLVLRAQAQEQQQQMTAMETQHEAEVAALKDTIETKAEDVWSGSVKFGFAGSEGNTEEMSLDGKVVAKRETDFDRLKLSLQGRYEKDDGAETKNEVIADAKLEHDLTERLFAFTALNLEHDKFEDIDLRTNVTGGLGYFLIKEDHHELKPHAGVGYEVTAYGSAPTEKEIVLNAGYDYRLDVLEKLRFTHSFNYLPAVDNIADDYRIDSDAALAYPLDDEKTWNVELGLRNQYDSMPAADVDNLDTYYSLGIARKFE